MMEQNKVTNLERYGNIVENFEPAPISDNSQVVLNKRYLLKDENDKVVENPNEMFIRVAKALAKIETIYGSKDEEIKKIENLFYQSMSSLEFLPNSPTLMNAGTGAGTLSACFVLPLTDSMEGIMKAAHDAAMVQKFGGGTGFSLSEIRPAGTPIATTHGKACGPIAVLKHLSSVSTLVTQGGKRDGANMAVMDVHHPNILDFIECKTIEGQIHNFNISVGASDVFMNAVKNGTDYPLLMKKKPAEENSETIEMGRLDARDVFNKIVHGAWVNGEPGMIFLDEVNRNSPVKHIDMITATNPCGEQPLLPNESCNLGSIDVSKFLYDTEQGTQIDWIRLSKTIRLSIRFLDNVIDANQYAIPEIEEMNKQTRKIGLGVMGFADLLVKLKIRYDSEEGLNTGRNLMKFIMEEADKASEELAKNRGPFEGWKGSRPQLENKAPLRNACRLTVAPTGTISMIAGCSSGIEPIFSLAFRKQNILEGKTLYYVDKNFEAIAKKRNFYSEELLEYLSEGGSLQNRDDVPNDIKEIFKTAPDISPENHVRMQAAFQDSVDAGISKTINFPNSATEEDVSNAYMLAWELDCKGITVYRAGSREKEVLTSGTTENPIKFKAYSNFWKGIYVLGAQKKSLLENVIIENVRALEDGLLKLTGAITFYRSDVDFYNVTIDKVSAEDAINIIESSFSMNSILIKNTGSDALDSDFSIGKIDNSKFQDIGGDALDFSGSTVQINNVDVFNVKDKAVSGGEESLIEINKGNFHDVGIGVASKDASNIVVTDTQIKNYRLFGVMSYVKKGFYSKPSSISLYGCNIDKQSPYLRQNGTFMLVDGLEIEENSFDVDKLYSSQEI